MKISTTDIEKRLDKKITGIFKRYNADKSLASRKSDISFSEFFTNKFLMISLIKEGIPYSFFHLIQIYAPFTEAEWADFLNISAKSLQRYKQADKIFKPIQSEKIIELAEVTNTGLDVFGSMEKFTSWLHTPSFALGRIKPIELLKDSYGKEMVLGELSRINYGILA